jgi:HTH-type transcriptional regulator/antitoxin HipB
LCKQKKQLKICKPNKQSIDCMSDYPIRTEQQVSLLLKSFRQARGMTQADLARALGVTQQTASDLERNAAAASVSRLLRMLSALGVELVLRDKQAASDTAAKPTPAAW